MTMHLRGLVLGVIGLAAISTGGINAQVLSDSLVDQRIRVHFARQDRSLEGHAPRQALRGILTDISGDSVTLRFHPLASPVTVSVNGIQQIDLSRGVSRSRTAVRQALLGAAYMGAIGAMNDHELGGGPWENYLIWAGGGAVMGVVLGIVLPEERWKRIYRR
jgi:hypothetical protein